MYYQLGAERSLSTLHLQLRALGVTIGLSTIKRYASRFAWQERIAALEADESCPLPERRQRLPLLAQSDQVLLEDVVA